MLTKVDWMNCRIASKASAFVTLLQTRLGLLSHLTNLDASLLHDFSSYRILQALTGFAETLDRHNQHNATERSTKISSELTARHEY